MLKVIIFWNGGSICIYVCYPKTFSCLVFFSFDIEVLMPTNCAPRLLLGLNLASTGLCKTRALFWRNVLHEIKKREKRSNSSIGHHGML